MEKMSNKNIALLRKLNDGLKNGNLRLEEIDGNNSLYYQSSQTRVYYIIKSNLRDYEVYNILSTLDIVFTEEEIVPDTVTMKQISSNPWHRARTP